jgi:hypothetical protein
VIFQKNKINIQQFEINAESNKLKRKVHENTEKSQLQFGFGLFLTKKNRRGKRYFQLHS